MSPRFQLALLCAKYQASLTRALLVRNTVCTERDWFAKSISNSAQYVTPDSKVYCETVKRCQFSSGNWFFRTNFVQLADKRRDTVLHLHTSKKECNKLDLTTARYFSLVDHNDWSRWFAISSPPRICSSSYNFIGGVAQKKQLNLDI